MKLQSFTVYYSAGDIIFMNYYIMCGFSWRQRPLTQPCTIANTDIIVACRKKAIGEAGIVLSATIMAFLPPGRVYNVK